jgi:hypothetical protein
MSNRSHSFLILVLFFFVTLMTAHETQGQWRVVTLFDGENLSANQKEFQGGRLPAAFELSLLSKDGNVLHVAGIVKIPGSSPAHIFSSSLDSGATWSPGGKNFSISNFPQLVRSRGKFFLISTSSHIMVSIDNGANWVKLTTGPGSAEFLPDVLAVNGDTIYASVRDKTPPSKRARILISKDNGEIWFALTSDAPNGVDFALLTGGNRMIANRDEQIYVSDDEGLTWKMNTVPGGSGGAVAAVNLSCGRNVYGYFSKKLPASRTGFYHLLVSKDAWSTWALKQPWGDENSMTISACEGNTVVARGFSVNVPNPQMTLVMVSKDGGDTWSSLEPLPNLTFNMIISGDEVYVVTRTAKGAGIFVHSLN